MTSETPASPLPVIQARGLNHWYGEGELRNQILFEVTVEIQAGEIVIMTGPSGSGKTTLLTLIGGLRSVQEGSLQVMGHELRGAPRSALQMLRRDVGYIFQSHNLLASLSALENVKMAMAHHARFTAQAAHERAIQMLRAVGLEDRMGYHPSKLSGGQRQRVSVARALAPGPRMLLADEPTAALDKQSGRDVVELLRTLARQQGIPILIVTHDNRILDVADRIISLEEGRLTSFSQAFMLNNRNTVAALMKLGHKDELMEQVRSLPPGEFTGLLQRLSGQFAELLQAMELLDNDALHTFMGNVLDVFGYKISLLLNTERGALFLLDEAKGELWSLSTINNGGDPLEIRIPLGTGIAGRVAATGIAMNVPDAYAEPAFNREVDMQTGYRTRNILCVPLSNREGRVFAVIQLINKRGGAPFTSDDENRFRDLAGSLSELVETWIALHRHGG
jgi:putative ABC transport system ATP-binding protein